MAIGRAFLWSEPARRFVCGGDIVATNSETVQVWSYRGKPRNDRAFVVADLYLDLIEEAQRALRAM